MKIRNIFLFWYRKAYSIYHLWYSKEQRIPQGNCPPLREGLGDTERSEVFRTLRLLLKAIFLISIVVMVALMVFSLGRQKTAPQVAIVIDDWGYNLDNLNLLKKIEAPVSISILPNLRYSSQVAQIAKELGKEVILHLPLEPEMKGREYIGLEQNTITAQMSKVEVIDNLKQALSSLSYAGGVSNHMGSRATKDKRLMGIIFTELKKRKLFFLDNLVTNKSICKELAEEMQIKFVARNFFLDNEDNYEYIKEQFTKLINFALENKQAVGIGHARLKTLEVLKDEIPLMQAKGIKLVFISNLAE